MDAVEQLASDCDGFLVGGLTVGEGTPHRADLGGASLSGAAFSPAVVEMATGLSQGCTPLTEPRIATEVQQNILIEIDGRPALDVLMEDIGPELASDLSQCAGVIFAARPVPGSDTADYTVRNLVGIDPEQKLVAIGDLLEDGDPIMFCRRDSESAVVDMRRMAGDLKRRIGDKPVRGGIYISCAARGLINSPRRNARSTLSATLSAASLWPGFSPMAKSVAIGFTPIPACSPCSYDRRPRPPMSLGGRWRWRRRPRTPARAMIGACS